VDDDPQLDAVPKARVVGLTSPLAWGGQRMQCSAKGDQLVCLYSGEVGEAQLPLDTGGATRVSSCASAGSLTEEDQR